MSGKSLAKAFVIGLLIYIGLNFGLYLIFLLTSGSIESYFAGMSVTSIFEPLFGPITAPPSSFVLAISLLLGSNDISYLLLALYYVIPGIIAAVVSTRFNETRYEAFGAWFLIAIVSFVMAMIGSILGGGSITVEYLLILILYLLINMAFYGFFACVSSKNDIY